MNIKASELAQYRLDGERFPSINDAGLKLKAEALAVRLVDDLRQQGITDLSLPDVRPVAGLWRLAIGPVLVLAQYLIQTDEYGMSAFTNRA